MKTETEKSLVRVYEMLLERPLAFRVHARDSDAMLRENLQRNQLDRGRHVVEARRSVRPVYQEVRPVFHLLFAGISGRYQVLAPHQRGGQSGNAELNKKLFIYCCT